MLRYFIFYKPFQVLSQFSPEENKKTLSDHFFDLPKDIYPVGRLDYDSEGLLLLTNDKHLSHRLLEPRYNHPRTYLVQVEGVPTSESISLLEKGVAINLNGTMYTTKPSKAVLLSTGPDIPERTPPIRYRKNIPDSWISLELTEGKNRQVRKMTAAAGYPTLRLIRYSIDKITLEGLKPGEFRELDGSIRQKLLNRGK